MTLHLIADIGGTNSRFALCEAGSTIPLQSEKFANQQFDGLESVIRHFLELKGFPKITEACIAVACPVTQDKVTLTNIDWSFSQEAIRTSLGWEKLYIINDFTALAMAIPHLPAEDIRKVGGGTSKEHAPIGILGPGTGIGVSGLLWTGHDWIALSGEGGHVALAACNDIESEIIRIGIREYGFVSAERILCGDGLAFLYRAMNEIHQWSDTNLSQAEIVDGVIQDNCPNCEKVIAQFCQFLATVSSDLALTLGAFGGIYIGGGIIPRIGEKFDTPFRQRFEDKGRFSGYVSGISTYVIASQTCAALYGAAAVLKQRGETQ